MVGWVRENRDQADSLESDVERNPTRRSPDDGGVAVRIPSLKRNQRGGHADTARVTSSIFAASLSWAR